MSSFWQKLSAGGTSSSGGKKPIFVMAPLANVTDVVFREIIARHGKPDVFYTEFVSADGLCSKGRDILLQDLKFTENQRPIVAQFFTSKPENMYKVSVLARELGFDGVDINMGCPDKSVMRQGAGAALIKEAKLAKEIIAAAKDGAKELPVSVKTRIGYSKIEIESLMMALLETDLVALSVHLRTTKEMSKVPAHWEVLKDIVAIKTALKKDTLIIGNGDVMSLEEGRRRVEETGADGVMLGRAIFGKPWLFADRKDEVTIQEKLKVLWEHVELFQEIWGDTKDFNIMKKHFKAYVAGFDGASDLRAKLMETKSLEEVRIILKNII